MRENDKDPKFERLVAQSQQDAMDEGWQKHFQEKSGLGHLFPLTNFPNNQYSAYLDAVTRFNTFKGDSELMVVVPHRAYDIHGKQIPGCSTLACSQPPDSGAWKEFWTFCFQQGIKLGHG